MLGGGLHTPAMVSEMRDWIAERRGTLDGFDIVLEGPIEPGDAGDELRRLADAGATWWVHSDWEASGTESQRRRIEAGPPSRPDR